MRRLTFGYIFYTSFVEYYSVASDNSIMSDSFNCKDSYENQFLTLLDDCSKKGSQESN